METFKKCLLVIAGELAGFAIAFMLFADTVSMEIYGQGGTLNGTDVIFGYKESGYQIFGFSFMNFLKLLIGIAGAVFVVLTEKKKNKMYKYISIACFAVSGIMCFFTADFVVQGKGMEKLYEDMGLSSVENKLACELVMSLLEPASDSSTSGIVLLLASVVVIVAVILDVVYAKKAEANADRLAEVAAPAQENAVAAEEVAVTEEAPVEEETEEKAE